MPVATLIQTARPLKRLSLQLLLLGSIYFISRCVFTLLNAGYFEGLTFAAFLRLCFHAVRYDISALLMINSLYILLLFLPLPVYRMPRWEKFCQGVFIVSNIAALLFEVSDWAYFPYNSKRSTADVLSMVGRESDFWLLLPGFLRDYWYIPLSVFLLVFVLIRGNRIICRMAPLSPGISVSSPSFRFLPGWQFLLLLVVGGLSLAGIRGGLQYIPIGLRNVLQVTESRFVPIVLNTPFSIINTLQGRSVEPLEFYPEDKLRNYINPVRHFSGRPFRRMNVVVIILESFSKEFTKLGGGKSYTPFLDSLMDSSLVCVRAYANALRSAEGIPAIISGIPALMEEPITTSPYGTNRITALPGLLKDKDYASAFYHGGTNGTMSFDVFCAAAGYDRYYGRKEYNNEQDYDGNWGIRDEPFLQYAVRSMSAMPEPFFATVFTLSSHPPYSIPEPYRQSLPAGDLPVYQSVAYTDMALQKFFASASRQSWYPNTLFVITADHSSPMSGNKYFRENLGRYAIPILYFSPADPMMEGRYDSITQQIDILPSVLDYLGYEEPFYALGNSIFRDSGKRYVINQVSGNYQWLMDGYLLKMADTSVRGLYAFPADSSCMHNLLPEALPVAEKKLLPYFRALLQEYRSALIRNQMYVD